MTEKLAVSVVVNTYNESTVIPGLLAGLPAALEGAGPYEVIVVDNNSADGTLEVVARDLPDATRVQLGRNAGYAAGINRGVAVARPSRAVLALNPDVRLMPGVVTRLLETLAIPGTGIAVPRIVDAHGRLDRSLRREPTVLRALGEALLGGRRAGRFHALGEVVQDPGRYEQSGTADWASGAVMLVSRECFDRVGRWDESFFFYSEETDFSLRARDAGFVLRYAPDAIAVHLGGSSHTSPRLWSILTVNRLRLFARRNGRLTTAAFWAALMLNEGLRAPLSHHRAVHRAALRALVQMTPAPQPRRIRAVLAALTVPAPAPQ